MTLSEAAKTGRKFRRANSVWCWLEGLVMVCDGGPVTIDAEMLISNDWEAELLKLEVDAEDIMRACRQFDEICSKRRLSAVEFGKKICVELGLIEEE